MAKNSIHFNISVKWLNICNCSSTWQNQSKSIFNKFANSKCIWSHKMKINIKIILTKKAIQLIMFHIWRLWSARSSNKIHSKWATEKYSLLIWHAKSHVVCLTFRCCDERKIFLINQGARNSFLIYSINWILLMIWQPL